MTWQSVLTHGSAERKRGIDDPGVLFVEHDGAGVQIRMDQLLGMTPVAVFHLSDFQL